MSVNLSLFAGVGAQFFDNNGVPLAGGLIYTYVAGTTTPAATYTSSLGVTAHANPIVLNSAGRVATGEVWLSINRLYKFCLYTSTNVLIATYDNVTGVGNNNNIVSLFDYGAVGNGMTDDTVAVQNAEAYVPIYAPNGTFLTTISNPTTLVGKQWGSGQIKTADGNKSAPNFSIISSHPTTTTGNQSSINTAFNGDISSVQFATGHVIKNPNTLTQPTTGYYSSFETAAFYTYLYNNSGHNESLSQPEGRTGTSAFMTKVDNYGQGDIGCYYGNGFVSGTKSGSTNFLANPAAVLFGGQMNCGANGVYMNPYEVNLQDNGYDVACVGHVNNFNRTNNTGAKNVIWMGYRAQSTGTKPIDAFLSATGLWNNGLDLVNANFDTNQSAISLKASQRIYFNNTATATGENIAWVTNNYGGEYVSYNSSLGLTTFYGQNAPQFAVAKNANAVNYLSCEGGSTGFAPLIRSNGSDTNINMGYSSKGIGYHFFYSNNSASVQFGIAGTETASVNYVLASGSATGIAPKMFANGIDVDIDLALNAKGTGVIDFGTLTAVSAGASAGYMVIKISGNSFKVPIYLT